MFINILGLKPQVQFGRVRTIAVSSARRASVFPDTPSVAEAYPEFDGYIPPAQIRSRNAPLSPAPSPE